MRGNGLGFRRGVWYKEEQGYTLLELLVVLAIAVLMLAAAPAIYHAVSPRAALVSATDGFAAELIDLGNRARTSGQRMGIKAGEDGTFYIVLPDEEKKLLPDGIILHVGDGMNAADEIWFYPNGRSAGGVLELIAGTRKTRIEIKAMTGAIEVGPL